MGLFQTEEERQAIIAKREELEERIINSPMTQIIIDIIMDKFGDLNAEKIQILRRLRADTVLGGYKVIVQKDGVIFSLLNMSESLEDWGISFDAMGYEDLSKEGTYILEKIIRDTLLGIPHLTINDKGLFLYNKDRKKKPW
ncbi:MAG: hypothetical protein HDR00_00055 [Lachnospiraceae bacterium]|nr:hypothetical protein [Lachnospiraceae bacterium]